jgi:glutaredoxin
MKLFFRYFFKTVRLILGPFMLAWEFLTLPKGIVRTPEDQARLDAKTRNLVLYQYKTCPFCMKVRRTLARLSLQVEKRDAQHDPDSRAELELQGGQIKVPCLRITDTGGRQRWLYESKEINDYLCKLAG